MFKLYNSISGQKEEFVPVNDKKIGLYSCGITVYDKMHIGHARTFIFVDLLVKLLRQLYKNVVYVRNITDVDDKINKRAVERKITIQQLTNEVIKKCNEDFKYLGNTVPDFEPKATETIKEIIYVIKKLIDNGNAYISNNHVLFDIRSYKQYGKLSHKNIKELEDGVRIENGDYKKNPLDFVLWKPSLDIDDESSKFESPWGLGRPGWHIECSAMSNKYLGENFDIHCGGVDLKFPHHENEIAQSCCAFKNSTYAKYWFHVGALMVNGQKMSKSLGNFITVEELINKGIKGSVLRFMILKNHYKKPFNFKVGMIAEANKNLSALHKGLNYIKCDFVIPNELIEVLCDDLNTVNAVVLLNKFKKNKEFEKLKNSMIFLGIYDEKFFKKENNLIDENEINKLILKRNEAKNNKNWAESDKIRDFLKDKNILLKDTVNGTVWDYINQ